MEKNAKIYIAGHTGLVGSALIRILTGRGYQNILTRKHQELDLIRQKDVKDFFRSEKPQYVMLAAAKVGGIRANSMYPAQFIYENLAIQTNVIHAAYTCGVKKLLFFGSACIYPRECPQPIKEEYLLSGYLEPTNEPYAVAKIAGIKMCEAYNKEYDTNFISALPNNIYGPNDNFDPEAAHVISALIRRFHEAKEKKLPSVEVWGSGTQRREFVYVDDVADAALFLMQRYDKSGIINVGTGEDITIRELAGVIKEIIDYKGGISFDTSKPDGMPRKMLDISKLTDLGWRAKVPLRQGIRFTYESYLKTVKNEKTRPQVSENIL